VQRFNRRQSIGILAGSFLGSVSTLAFAQEQKSEKKKKSAKKSEPKEDGPKINADERRLLQSLENSPWIATGKGDKPLYMLWAPWCPICRSVMQDVAKGSLDDVEIRWIGAGSRNGEQRAAVASVVKLNSSDALRNVLLGQPVAEARLAQGYVDRVNASDLMFAALSMQKKARGYPTFAYFDGKEVRIESGNPGAEAVKRLTDKAVSSNVRAPDISYLEAEWKDLGSASGKPHDVPNGYTIYSLPSTKSVAVVNVKKGRMWPQPTRRLVGVGSQKWASVDTGIRFGNGPALEGYVRVS